ncbi:adenosine kinase [Thiorhodovibrio frisius]|uniref:Sugar kinase, ribokinase n=1 Tax=Thiorhodovibrio frisius TaxID=631362 RepID=H8YWU2_9GAMM|nr:adenosine kinase [Thiorhodovibrio frisius]EIC22918.1 sugar kinase, ribokinase [Thiorhodovibrio frisius]WPL22823.1 putative sugar kinase YdjH [Thiorhodovibrio frisius]
MPAYDLYALGNALVDMEYSVTPEDLNRLEIDKGVMTLVDEAHQLRIMNHLREHDHHRGSGGSAANSIIALSQFGGQGYYSCKVADDELGHFYLKDLVTGGIATRDSSFLDQGDTGRCVVLVTPDSDRTMCTYLGISGNLSVHEVDTDALRASKWFYTEGYLVTSDTARVAAIEARKVAEQAGVKTALSLSDPNMVNFFKDGLKEMIGEKVDLIFANEAEAMGMADTDDLNQAVDYLKSVAREFAITRGPEGALIFDGKELIDIDPVPVKAVDTVGAGDMFAGAFLYGLTQGWSHARAGRLASAASAKLVTSLGPRISREESQAILKQVEAA